MDTWKGRRMMIKINDLPMGSIVLAPSWMHPILRAENMQAHHGMIGVRMFSITGFLSTFSTAAPTSPYETIFAYYRSIEAIYPKLTIYASAAKTLHFLEACLSMINDLKRWNISCEQLPKHTAAQRELHMILQALYSIRSNGNIHQEGLQHLPEDLHHVYIYPSYMTIEEHKLIQIFETRGAHRIQAEQNNIEKHFYHAVNKRQEVEACAQYIIQHQLDAQDIYITLADMSIQPLLAQIFERYEIPFTPLQQSTASIVTKRCNALFQYYLNPSRKNLMNCIDYGLFHCEHIQTLRNYMELFSLDIDDTFDHLRNIQEEGHIVNAYDLLALQRMEERASSCQPELCDMIEVIRHPKSYEELFMGIIQVLDRSILKQQERSVFIKIRESLKELFFHVHSDEDIQLALPLIQGIQQHVSVDVLQGVLITNLTQSIPNRSHHFMIGCTQKQYPAFPIKTGIFDETYYRELNYPSMEERYQLHQQLLQQHLTQAPYTYVSYPVGTYDGKAQEAALEIEQWMKKRSTSYPLVSHTLPYHLDMTLSKEMARDLFVKDGAIPGSISSWERYVKCPFSYFLRYGLGLREPMDLGFSDSYMGTLAHYILETLVAQYGKHYTKTTTAEIDAILDKEIQCISAIFINRRSQLASMKTRIHDSFLQLLERLDELEEHSHVQPWKQEEEFHHSIPLDIDVNMLLHGFIDRIDMDGSFACIYDYKSSAKILSEKDVFAGLQLQLLTYAIMVHKKYQKDLLGTFYISLKNANVAQDAGTLSRRKPVTYTPVGKEECLDNWLKAHRIRGWTMNPNIEVLDDDGSHITGVRQNKEGMIKASKTYDIHTIERWFTQMYQMLGKQLLNGHIACEPNEEACLFCSYHEICRYKGMYVKKPLMIEIDEDLYWKGDEDDANME